MLKLTGIEIDLMNDQEMYEMIKSGRRGEMTQTNCKKVEANDKGYKDMGADCHKNKDSSYIKLFRRKQLIYVLSMIRTLPFSN